LILRSFGWVFVLSLSLAIGGGMFLSSQVWQRIEAIIRTAEGIIEGDLSQRVPRRAAPDDLDRLAATLNRMLDRMTGLMESLRHVSNDVAHDLRTPLGRLRHCLEEARETARTSNDYQAALDTALAEIDAILDTFAAILRIAQIESGRGRTGFRQLSFSDLVEDVCESYTPSFEDADKTLLTNVAPGLALRGDPDLLAQSLANLLENAIRHTPAGTIVMVSAAHRASGIELTVADNGAGVPEEEHVRIFDRFYRLDGSRSVAGNGLGLSIVAAVAALHDADVGASSNRPGLKVRLRFSGAAVAAA
jgi:signal transduction histidine kinase